MSVRVSLPGHGSFELHMLEDTTAADRAAAFARLAPDMQGRIRTRFRGGCTIPLSAHVSDAEAYQFAASDPFISEAGGAAPGSPEGRRHP